MNKPGHLPRLDLLRRAHEVPNRLAIADYLRERNLIGDAIEVGVWRGDYAEPFVNRWRGKCLHLVDPWRKLPDFEYDDIRNIEFDPDDYEFVVRRFAKYGDRVKIVRALSVEAAANFPAESVDFVYIDANHNGEYVYQDLRVWWSRIKKGGVLAGHDVFCFGYPSLTVALITFLLEENTFADLIEGDDTAVNSFSYLIQK